MDKIEAKKDRFSAKGDSESLKQKTKHRPPHHYANNCHRGRISKILWKVATNYLAIAENVNVLREIYNQSSPVF